MKKIIPILSICIAALNAAVSAVGLLTVCVATAVPQLALVALPFAIAGAVSSLLSCGVNALFVRDRLCRIALFIDIGATVAAFTAITVWLAAL
ncbi:MAG: hypothetical protein NC184_03095 [Roseburia sp.]|nr:hypothetical protein [Roseburia sp.]